LSRNAWHYLAEECEVSGAERLIDLDGTGDFHTPWTSMSPHYEFSLEELRKLVDTGAKFRIPTFANKSPFPNPTPLHGWKSCGMAPHDRADYHETALQKEYLDLYKKMGLMDTLPALLSDQHLLADDGTALRVERELRDPLRQRGSRRALQYRRQLRHLFSRQSRLLRHACHGKPFTPRSL
jgi:hypothetical protein